LYQDIVTLTLYTNPSYREIVTLSPFTRPSYRDIAPSPRPIGTLRGVSRPFARTETGKIAVKAINHYGDEVLKVFEVSSRAEDIAPLRAQGSTLWNPSQ
jgi:hypothetical protein